MLKGISPLISPELLKTLSEMGHGDEIILADAHFPAHSYNTKVLRLDGVQIAPLLSGILSLLELDSYVLSPLVMMNPVEGDELDPVVEQDYLKSIRIYYPNIAPIERMGRFNFYDRAKEAFAIVMTGETAKYGNIILKKGITSQK